MPLIKIHRFNFVNKIKIESYLTKLIPKAISMINGRRGREVSDVLVYYPGFEFDGFIFLCDGQKPIST